MLQVWGGLGIQTSRIDRDWSASAVSESFKGKDKYYQCFLKTRARARHISIIPAPQEAETGHSLSLRPAWRALSLSHAWCRASAKPWVPPSVLKKQQQQENQTTVIKWFDYWHLEQEDRTESAEINAHEVTWILAKGQGYGAQEGTVFSVRLRGRASVYKNQSETLLICQN